jgi:hypothetical protein
MRRANWVAVVVAFVALGFAAAIFNTSPGSVAALLTQAQLERALGGAGCPNIGVRTVGCSTTSTQQGIPNCYDTQIVRLCSPKTVDGLNLCFTLALTGNADCNMTKQNYTCTYMVQGNCGSMHITAQNMDGTCPNDCGSGATACGAPFSTASETPCQ